MGKSKVVLYGAFKAMGDFLSAAPVIKSELSSGSQVVLLIFPNLRGFIDLIDFGAGRDKLRIVPLPVSGLSSFRMFFRSMASISPDLIWISPHAPGPASSWKIPLLLWLSKRVYWPRATMAGVASERMSRLFDVRVPADRLLPFADREWTAYSLLSGQEPISRPLPITFKQSIHAPRREQPAYDLLIHPGAGAANRKWPFTHYPELIAHIPRSYSIAVLGLPEDIAGMKQVLPVDREIRYISGTIEESITAIARARVALTMDSGNMFFANVLGVPTVSIFGASNPANVIGIGGVVSPTYEQRLSCQPCGRPKCIHDVPYCITSISPVRVAEELLRLLQQHVQELPY